MHIDVFMKDTSPLEAQRTYLKHRDAQKGFAAFPAHFLIFFLEFNTQTLAYKYYEK